MVNRPVFILSSEVSVKIRPYAAHRAPPEQRGTMVARTVLGIAHAKKRSKTMNCTTKTPRVALAIAMLAALTAVLMSCAAPTVEPVLSGGGCTTDLSCPLGEECGDGGCVPVAPTIYSHIQTVSALLRLPLDDEEVAWRAAHYDMLIGTVVRSVDAIRAINPHARLFEYMCPRYDVYGRTGSHIIEWVNDNGYEPEDFYMHYREDTEVPHWSSDVLVEGYPPGIIPGWNPNWSPGDPPASATDRAMSRVVGFFNTADDQWYMFDVNYAGFRNFVLDWVATTLDGSRLGLSYSTGPIDGIMMDWGIYYPDFNEGNLEKSEEYYGIPLDEDHPYPIGVETLYPELASGLKERLGRAIDVMPNYGHVFFLSREDRFSLNVQKTSPWIWGEVWVMYRGYHSPTLGPTRVINYESDYENGIANIVTQTRRGGRRVLGARDLAGAGEGSDRGKLYTLAMYYLVHSANTFYLYETHNHHNKATHISSWQWNPAVEFDVGQPTQIPPGAVDFEGRPNTNEHYVLTTGPDPYNPDLTYKVLARRFTNALVLVKMLPRGSVVDDNSLTTHALDRSYVPLKADGTLGDVTTEVQIRNNEGVILIPVD